MFEQPRTSRNSDKNRPVQRTSHSKFQPCAEWDTDFTQSYVSVMVIARCVQADIDGDGELSVDDFIQSTSQWVVQLQKPTETSRIFNNPIFTRTFFNDIMTHSSKTWSHILENIYKTWFAPLIYVLLLSDLSRFIQLKSLNSRRGFVRPAVKIWVQISEIWFFFCFFRLRHIKTLKEAPKDWEKLGYEFIRIPSNISMTQGEIQGKCRESWWKALTRIFCMSDIYCS